MHGSTYVRTGGTACMRPRLLRSASCVLCLDVLYSVSSEPLHAPSLDVLSLDVVKRCRDRLRARACTCIPSDMGSRSVSRSVRRDLVPPRSAPSSRGVVRRPTFSLPKVKRRTSRAFFIGALYRGHPASLQRTRSVPRYMLPQDGRVILRCRASRGPLAAAAGPASRRR